MIDNRWHLLEGIALMVGRAVPLMAWTEFTTLCTILHCCMLELHLSKFVRVLGDMPNFLKLLRKQSHWHTFFKITNMGWAQNRSSEMLMFRNLKLVFGIALHLCAKKGSGAFSENDLKL